VPEHRPFKNYPDAELYSMVVQLEQDLDEPGLDHIALHRQLAQVEDEIEYREWD